jgi:hypothetical protein
MMVLNLPNLRSQILVYSLSAYFIFGYLDILLITSPGQRSYRLILFTVSVCTENHENVYFIG